MLPIRTSVIIPPINSGSRAKNWHYKEEIIQKGAMIVTPDTPPIDYKPRNTLNEKLSKAVMKQ